MHAVAHFHVMLLEETQTINKTWQKDSLNRCKAAGKGKKEGFALYVLLPVTTTQSKLHIICRDATAAALHADRFLAVSLASRIHRKRL